MTIIKVAPCIIVIENGNNLPAYIFIMFYYLNNNSIAQVYYLTDNNLWISGLTAKFA